MSAGIRRLAAGPEYGRAFGSVMLTPWLAVSAGIVLAASLSLVAPHAALTFPPDSGRRCPGDRCHRGASHSPGLAAPASRQDPRLRPPGGKASGPSRSPIRVGYELLPRGEGRFMAVIVLVGRRPLGRWNLGLVLPGGHIDSVMWAHWRPAGPHGVDVTGSPLPWPRSGADEARIVLLGTGSPRWPGGCVIDGTRCRFRAIGTR